MIFYSIESNYNSYNVHENFLTLNSGSMMELNKICVNKWLSIVGIVDNTSPKFATVVVIWMWNPINAKIKKSNHFWFLSLERESTILCSWLMSKD
jgi:rod shape-determining protein MreC